MAEIPFEPYTGQSKLRFWCQKVLPLVYDDSLSYYELLGKVIEYLNNTINDVSACEDNITALRDAFVRLQDYVNEQLEDFAPEVERIIDEMIESGEFGEILADTVNGLIANEYSTTQGYAQFDYVIKDGKLYCATASTSGEWDATKWRETTVGADMQLLNQRVYNLNAGQVAFNENTTYDNGTVGKKLKDLDDFDDNLNAGQVAFNESTTYDNGTVGKKLKDLDDFDDNLNAGQVAFDETATYGNNTVGKKLKDLDDFDDNLNAGQVAFNESTTYDNNTVGKKLKDLDDFDDNLNAGQVGYNSQGTYDNATVGKELQELNSALLTKVNKRATSLSSLNELGDDSLFFVAIENIPIGNTGVTISQYARGVFINYNSNEAGLLAVTIDGDLIWAYRISGTWTKADSSENVYTAITNSNPFLKRTSNATNIDLTADTYTQLTAITLEAGTWLINVNTWLSDTGTDFYNSNIASNYGFATSIFPAYNGGSNNNTMLVTFPTPQTVTVNILYARAIKASCELTAIRLSK